MSTNCVFFALSSCVQIKSLNSNLVFSILVRLFPKETHARSFIIIIAIGLTVVCNVVYFC